MMREKSPIQERMIACVELNTEKTRKRLDSHQPLFLCLLVRKPDIYLLCSVDGDYIATKADYGLLQGAVHRMKGSLLRIVQMWRHFKLVQQSVSGSSASVFHSSFVDTQLLILTLSEMIPKSISTEISTLQRFAFLESDHQLTWAPCVNSKAAHEAKNLQCWVKIIWFCHTCIVASRKDSCRRFNPFYRSVIFFVNRQLQENWEEYWISWKQCEFTIEKSSH